MKVAVTQTIDCAHQLEGTELHGHTYRITAVFETEGYENGMTFDVLRRLLTNVTAPLDHRRLEEVIGEPACAERLAYHVRREVGLPCMVRVEVGCDGWVETE